ncbi:MAG: hypothetical protein UV67_C0007G0024 [Parcubacteria group bacterium GW2011_GWC1_43_12]|nr:MAG: hypothetical protein UV34_C0005G0014 [Parcubacteria group bacterium GW2011_GWB1_42_6]KKS92258.1 MAG: hypothetical protein UV67_C0007G0024 [Parcubacteria group bacterium GW2011_GWC1_43_12]
MNSKDQTLKQISTKKAGAVLRNIKPTPLFCLSGKSENHFSPNTNAGLLKFWSVISRSERKKIKRYVLIIGPSFRERQKNGQFYRSRKAGSNYFAKVEPAKANWQQSKSNLNQ